MINAQRDDLIEKVTALVREKFAGSWNLAWDFYDTNRDGKVSTDELTALLINAKIGTRITRPIWCIEIVAYLDRDNDGMIDREEFFDVFRERT